MLDSITMSHMKLLRDTASIISIFIIESVLILCKMKDIII